MQSAHRFRLLTLAGAAITALSFAERASAVPTLIPLRDAADGAPSGATSADATSGGATSSRTTSGKEVQVNAKRISVQFDTLASAQAAARAAGATFRYLPRISRFKGFACGYFELATAASSGSALQNVIGSLRAAPGVRHVGPDYRIRPFETPNDPDYNQLWAMPKIEAPEAWDIRNDASSVVVMIIDTGINYDHQDLAPNIWTNPDEVAGNGVDDDMNGYVDDMHGIDVHNGDADPKDDQGHGSHVAGTIGAVGNEGIGVVGICWKVKMMSCKAMADMGSDSVVPECLEYTLAMKEKGYNIAVTNNSWGADGDDPNIEAGFQALGAANIINACAAGNDSADNDSSSDPGLPASYDDPSIISVMSTEQNDSVSGFSSYGKMTVDLAAPGGSIYSTHHTPNGYTSMSGTSMACPHVAGALALLAAQTGTNDVPRLRQLLLDNVDVVGGLGDYCATSGRLNLRKALDAAGDGPGGMGGMGGTSGMGGAAGSAGNAGTAGAGGTGGAAGLGGTSGVGGAAGTAGAAGSSTGGNGGLAGSAGASGGAGAGSGGAGGTVGGSGGTSGNATGGAATTQTSEDGAGCGCRIGAPRGNAVLGGLLGLALIGLRLRRRPVR